MNIQNSSATVRTNRRPASTAVAGAVLVALASVSAQATSPTCHTVATLTTLHTFAGSDGFGPAGKLFLASDGNFYGTTWDGGASGMGTVFRISPTGTFTLLHSFSDSDGQNPYGGVIQDSDGNLYGTTANGGSSSSGTLYEITLGGSFSTRVNFAGASGVAGPIGSLLHAGGDNLRGVTASDSNLVNTGAWFSYSPSLGTLTEWLQWTPPQTPVSGFSLGTDGSYYGTTYGSQGSGGTAYRISPTQGYVQMHAFPGPVWPSGSTDGLQPQGGLTVGSDGNVYGMTMGGGASGDGTIFKIDTVAIDPKYPETQLYSWSGGQAAAVGPDGTMTLGTDGNLYGVRGPVAGSNEGAIFEITPSGTFTNWYTFSGPDGGYPMAGLAQGANGSFYGTTFEGGANGDGTVFELSFGEQCLVKE